MILIVAGIWLAVVFVSSWVFGAVRAVRYLRQPASVRHAEISEERAIERARAWPLT